jgi:hypothetical protein
MIILRTSLLKNYRGMTLWPLLLVARDQDCEDPVFINHENIHAVQQKELLLVFFYVWYVLDYLKHRISKSHHDAYRSIIFEKEAYNMELDLEYLNTRKVWAFLSFKSVMR